MSEDGSEWVVVTTNAEEFRKLLSGVKAMRSDVTLRFEENALRIWEMDNAHCVMSEWVMPVQIESGVKATIGIDVEKVLKSIKGIRGDLYITFGRTEKPNVITFMDALENVRASWRAIEYRLLDKNLNMHPTYTHTVEASLLNDAIKSCSSVDKIVVRFRMMVTGEVQMEAMDFARNSIQTSLGKTASEAPLSEFTLNIQSELLEMVLKGHGDELVMELEAECPLIIRSTMADGISVNSVIAPRVEDE